MQSTKRYLNSLQNIYPVITMKRINLQGQKIRLFFHTDMDGTVAANLIQLHSGAKIVQLVPCQHSEYRGKLEREGGILNVFVDCRSTNRDEDVRIDHHESGEDKEYLARETVILEPSYKSAASLVAKVFNVKVEKQVLKELDKADSADPTCVFSRFIFGRNTMYKILSKPGLRDRHYQDYELFKDTILGFMEKGFAIEDIDDTPEGYEKKLEKKFKVVIEDIKKPDAPLVKFVHSPTTEGLFREHVFKLTDSDFFSKVQPYVKQHYYAESQKGNLGIYVAVGFRARNHGYDAQAREVAKDDHPEPYQIFVSRGEQHASLNIGTIIQDAKKHADIQNGGGRDDVGGLNSSDKRKAIKALSYIIKRIRKDCP
jgi:hypothetical protein